MSHHDSRRIARVVHRGLSAGEAAPASSPGAPSSVAERLDRLAPDQRAAATAPPGPVLCVAPAGSGKTTTLVARIAWLVATGADPAGSPRSRSTSAPRTRWRRAWTPRWSRSAWRPARSGSRRSTPSGARSSPTAASRVEPLLDRESVLRDMWPDIDRGRHPPARRRVQPAQAGHRRHGRRCGDGSRARADRPRLPRLRVGPRGCGRARLRRSGRAGAAAARGPASPPPPLARTLHAPAGRRDPGRRPKRN